MDWLIKLLLISLLIFTPIAFGGQTIWASSLMELGILLIMSLWAIQCFRTPQVRPPRGTQRELRITALLLSIFLGLILLQMTPLPGGLIELVSPRTYELKSYLLSGGWHANDAPLTTTLSFLPFATKVEFFKWVTLSGLFVFLLQWRPAKGFTRVSTIVIVAVMMVGIFESLYGVFEFFSGHRHILTLDFSKRMSSVTGTFVNRNYFAGYLVMAIPLATGFLVSREVGRSGRVNDWRRRLARLDGKTLILGFGVIIMIVGLLVSTSRMGILSLLMSFSLIALLFRDPTGGNRIYRVPALIFGLAMLWSAFMGLDVVISRFFSVAKGLQSRWPIWVDTVQILRDFPVFGTGLGTFASIFPVYRSFHIRGIATHAENDFLQLISDTGFLGAGLLLVLFAFLIFRAIWAIHDLPHSTGRRYISMGGLVGILGFMFHSGMERNIQVPANAFLYTVTLAILLRTALDSHNVQSATRGEKWFHDSSSDYS
jgi:O-antigen ligase